MPINLRKPKTKDQTSVETLLDMAKAKLLQKLEDRLLTGLALSYARRAEWILPGESFADVSVSHLFPIAVQFCGESVNKTTYATAQRALRADYEILMEAIRLESNTQQQTKG